MPAVSVKTGSELDALFIRTTREVANVLTARLPAPPEKAAAALQAQVGPGMPHDLLLWLQPLEREVEESYHASDLSRLRSACARYVAAAKSAQRNSNDTAGLSERRKPRAADDHRARFTSGPPVTGWP